MCHADYSGQDNHPLYVPGCSRGNAKQIISNSMAKAYVAMRGPRTTGAPDPLIDWVRCRNQLANLDPPPGHRENVAQYVESPFLHFPDFADSYPSPIASSE